MDLTTQSNLELEFCLVVKLFTFDLNFNEIFLAPPLVYLSLLIRHLVKNMPIIKIKNEQTCLSFNCCAINITLICIQYIEILKLFERNQDLK